MLQQEFEERTGLKLPVDSYVEVEECCTNTDLDKDDVVSCGLRTQPHLKAEVSERPY